MIMLVKEKAVVMQEGKFEKVVSGPFRSRPVPIDIYSHVDPFFQGSIGQHVRHSLDHFEKLLKHYQEDITVDYDSRKRDTMVEKCTDSAIAQIDHVIAVLEIIMANYELSRKNVTVRF